MRALMKAALLLGVGLWCSSANAQLDPDQADATAADCPAGTNIIMGTPGNDRIRGTRGDDCIVGMAGDDRIWGRGGNDVLIGGPGNDRLYGQNGDDVIFGGPGRDRASGGRGDDTIFGFDGNDILRGNRGNDVLFGGAGNDNLRGGSNNDVVDGGDGNDRIYGDNGADVLIGGAGNDKLMGRRGDDQLVGGAGRNRLNGGRGNDSCDLSHCRGDTRKPRTGSVFLVSDSPLRTAPQSFDRNFVDGNLYAFVPNNDIVRVRFFLNDPSRSGRPALVDVAHPFDFCGTQRNGDAAPFPTTRFTPNGVHISTAEILHGDGTIEVIHAAFTVEN